MVKLDITEALRLLINPSKSMTTPGHTSLGTLLDQTCQLIAVSSRRQTLLTYRSSPRDLFLACLPSTIPFCSLRRHSIMSEPPLSPSTPPESGPRPLEHASATADEGFTEVFGPDSPTAAVLPSGDVTAGASRTGLDRGDTLKEEAREESGKKGEKAVALEHPCPYSAFSSREKALIVVLVSTAAIFSYVPLSSILNRIRPPDRA